MIGVEHDRDRPAAGLDAAKAGRFLVALDLRLLTVRERHDAVEGAARVAIKSRAADFARRVHDGLTGRANGPEMDVYVPICRPIRRDQETSWLLHTINVRMRRGHGDNNHREHAKEKIGEADPDGGAVAHDYAR